MAEVGVIKKKADIQRFEDALHGRDRLLVTIGVSVGLRISDLLTLKVGDLRRQKELKLAERKTGKVRAITLNKKVRSAAKTLTGEPGDYVFKSQKGNNKPISTTQAYRILNAAAERAGLSDKIGAVGTHTLRKTFGYRLYANGYDLTRIMTILNHSTEAMTLKYIGVTKDEISSAYESVDW